MKEHRVQYELTAYQGKDVIFIRFAAASTTESSRAAANG